MGVAQPAILAFNRGLISPLALARTDFKRTALSAEVQTNWLPRSLGAMTIRPGMEYTGATRSNANSITIPFIYSNDDMARLELTGSVMRIWVDDALVTRPAVTAAVTNGNFDTDITGWSDQDTGTSVSQWATGGYMELVGSGTGSAKRRQQVTVIEPNVVHALKIEVARGSVNLRVGSTAGGDDYVTETTLGTGYHNIAFTPTGDFYIDLFTYEFVSSLILSCVLASSGTVDLTTPWVEADLPSIRWDQSGDVIFIACYGYRQKRIERRNNNSWSVVDYVSDNGPFRAENTGPITMTPSVAAGDGTLTSSLPYFRTGHVGALFRLEQSGQSAQIELNGEDQFSDHIRVTGMDGERAFAIIITGTFVADITLQYSVGDPGAWVDAGSGIYSAETSITYDDTLDDQIIYYRIGIKAGDYTSGTATALLSYSSGSQTGIARVTSYTSSTVVNIAVLTDFGNTDATSTWWENYWSSYRGYPSSVALHEGRLWWAGKDRIWGSVPDGFANFDDTLEGDSAPISRSIGSGPVDKIHWLAPLQRLVLGADAAIRTARSSSLDEPLTPSNFNLKAISTDGANGLPFALLDTSAIYASGTRVHEVSYDTASASYDYGTSDICMVVPEIGEPGIVRIAVQRRPEKRIHVVRTDGTVALMVYHKQEDVTAWVEYETAGEVEDVCVLPGDVEDSVYYTVKRTINGSTVRYHEKFALESECRGFPEAKLADAFSEWSGASATTITGLSHLEGESVVVWGWNTTTPFTNAGGDTIGRYFGTFTVSGGQVSGLSASVTNAIVGLPYEATYKSTKLAYGTGDASALCLKKRVAQIGVIAKWLHASGLRYGPSFDFMDDLPQIENGGAVDSNDVRLSYDEEMFGFDGDWDTDSRVCLKAVAPKPATVLACVVSMETHA